VDRRTSRLVMTVVLAALIAGAIAYAILATR
jgi:hypothetical protein